METIRKYKETTRKYKENETKHESTKKTTRSIAQQRAVSEAVLRSNGADLPTPLLELAPGLADLPCQ